MHGRQADANASSSDFATLAASLLPKRDLQHAPFDLKLLGAIPLYTIPRQTRIGQVVKTQQCQGKF